MTQVKCYGDEWEAYVDDEANPMALNHLAAHFFWKGELDRVKDFCMQSYKATTHDGMRSESLLLQHLLPSRLKILQTHRPMYKIRCKNRLNFLIESASGSWLPHAAAWAGCVLRVCCVARTHPCQPGRLLCR